MCLTDGRTLPNHYLYNGLESTAAFYGLNKENNNEKVDSFSSDPDSTYFGFCFCCTHFYQ
ncbi:conserved hypothetical protein [Vibrio chagasii]|nr:conserved hypothetical protein [Vibrio chagasii]CAH7456416.1 conserved hypothetical protein [Vibrio chagasii]